MLRLLSIPLALLILLAGAMAWSGSATTSRADFTFVIASDILTLDTNQMSYLQDMRLAYSIWEGLYVYDGMTLEPVPGVAKSVDISPDKRVYTFHFRDDSKWSNGDPVTTRDFVFAWRRMLESPGEYTYLHYYIKGAEPYLKAYAEFVGDPKNKPRPDFASVGIEAIDAKTLRVTLDNPVTFFLELMAFPPFMPLHEPSMKPFAQVDPITGHTTYDGKFTRPGVVGNGPYRLTAWDFKRRVWLEKSETYWDRANVKTRSIEMLVVEDPLGEFMRYESGDVDWIPTVPSEMAPELRIKGRKDLRIFDGFGSVYINVMIRPKFNDGRDNPLADIRVRQALAMAIDKNPIVQNITRMGEKPATNYIPPDIFPGFNVDPGIAFNPKRARELLAEAGFSGRRELPGVTYMFRSGNPTAAATAQNIANQWKANLGLEVPLEQMESKIARQRINEKGYSLATGNWIGDYQDPSTFTDKYLSTSANNDSAWINKEFDSLCAAATKEADPQKRYRLLERANRLIDTELPVIPLYTISNQYLFRDNVHGINTSPRNMTMFKGVWVDRQGAK
jgi:oligopeptide transport system substrate-binding protein